MEKFLTLLFWACLAWTPATFLTNLSGETNVPAWLVWGPVAVVMALTALMFVVGFVVKTVTRKKV